MRHICSRRICNLADLIAFRCRDVDTVTVVLMPSMDAISSSLWFTTTPDRQHSLMAMNSIDSRYVEALLESLAPSRLHRRLARRGIVGVNDGAERYCHDSLAGSN